MSGAGKNASSRADLEGGVFPAEGEGAFVPVGRRWEGMTPARAGAAGGYFHYK